MERTLSAAEFAEWIAYYGIDPFGDQREDLRFAMLAAMVAGACGAKGVQMKNYMLYPQAEKNASQTPQQMRDVASLVSGWFSGQHHRKT